MPMYITNDFLSMYIDDSETGDYIFLREKWT